MHLATHGYTKTGSGTLVLALVGVTLLGRPHPMHLCHVYRHVSQYPSVSPLYVTTSPHTNACSDTILPALVVEPMLRHAIFSNHCRFTLQAPIQLWQYAYAFLISLHILHVHAPNRACSGNLVQALLVLWLLFQCQGLSCWFPCRSPSIWDSVTVHFPFHVATHEHNKACSGTLVVGPLRCTLFSHVNSLHFWYVYISGTNAFMSMCHCGPLVMDDLWTHQCM